MSSKRNRPHSSMVRGRSARRAFQSDSAASARSSVAPSAPVIQFLEPRKLLTTLYAGGVNAFGAQATPPEFFGFPFSNYSGYFSTFIGYIAMPKFIDIFSGQQIRLDSSSVESRSVLVLITIIDPTADPLDPESGPSVSIKDLDGNDLYPWRGQPDGGDFTTELEASIATGSLDPGGDNDNLWGTDDDETTSGFGLDIGYNPGYRLFPGLDLAFGTADDIWGPDWFFHPERVLEYDEDLGEFVLDDIPTEYNLIFPHSGIWHNGDTSGDDTTVPDYEEQLYLPEAFWNDSRTPPGILGETDDRVFGNGDDPSAGDGGAYGAPSNFDWHLMDRFTSPTVNDLPDYADDGIADFNNGIGQIIFRNTTQFTRFTMTVVELDGNGQPTVFTPFGLPEESDVGVMFDVKPGNVVDGSVVQAPLMGRIIVGNPTNADWTVDAPLQNFGSFLIDIDTKRQTEGISFENPGLDEPIRRIAIDGALFGRNIFPGAIEYLHVGFLGGSIEVDGEVAGGIIVAGDAGFIDYTFADQGVFDRTTGAFISVGRNVGSILVGGRNAAVTLVEGDLFDYSDSPAFPNGNVINEFENVQQDADEEGFAFSFSRGLVGYIKDPVNGGDDTPQYLHNDTIGFAQYVGRANSVVTVSGTIGGGEAFGRHSGNADDFDYFAVAVDGRSKITITLVDPLLLLDLPVYLSIQDERGRVLASRGTAGLADSGELGAIEFTPDHAGIIYIVVRDTLDLAAPTSYLLTIQGHEGVTLGEVNTIEQFQFRAGEGTSILTSAGSIGTVRTGQDIADTDSGNLTDMVIDSAGSIWNLTAGHNIGADDSAILISADVNIGSILAGFGRGEDGTDEGFNGGSLLDAIITTGNDIGLIWALGAENDFGDIGGTTENNEFTAVPTFISAGGSIGVIRADNRIYGGSTEITCGDDGVIDLIEAGMQIVGADGGDGNVDVGRETSGDFGITRGDLFIRTGSGGGGNVRFFRAPSISGNGNSNPVIELEEDNTLQLVDDSGALFTIRINSASASGLASFAFITTQGINGSQGVAVARISVFLAPGADLVITNNSGQVEIGDIIVTGLGTGGLRNSEIIINGSGNTDVHYLRATGVFDQITNSTSGDMIAIDVSEVIRVKIAGNLGRTDNIDIGPKLIGPELGVSISAPGALPGFGLTINPLALSGGQDEVQFGGPYDGFLNGLVVRLPNVLQPVESVLIDGTIGDCIILNNVERIIANANGDSTFGRFQGIEGTVYAEGNLEYIDVGEGLVAYSAAPSLNAGITALGQLVKVVARGEGHDIYGVIMAMGVPTFGLVNGKPQDVEQAIGLIELTDGANMIGAFISTSSLDDYWFDPITDEDGSSPVGDIKDIRIVNGDMRYTRIEGINVGLAEFIDIRNNQQRRLGAISITGGVWDSNKIRAIEGVGRVNADSFIATNLDDDSALVAQESLTPETARSLIIATDNIESIETNGQRGDIIDLYVNTLGNLSTFRGYNIIGVAFDVDSEVERIDAKGYISRSKFVTGIVSKFEAQGDIDRVTLETAGPLSSLRSRSGEIRRISLIIDGPDGRLDKMNAVTGISGDIAVSGEIRQIKTTTGDITAAIRTFSGDGYIKEISAGRDLLISLDADGNVDRLRAARNVGNGGVINVRGNLKDLDASRGTLFSPVVVTGNLTGKFNVLTMDALANLTVGGSIKQVTIVNDFDNFIISHSGGIAKVDLKGSLGSSGAVTALDGAISSLNVAGDMAGAILSDRDGGKIAIRGNLTGSIVGNDSLTSVDVDGSATNALILAGLSLQKLTIDGGVTSSVIGAGRSIDNLTIGGNSTGSFILGGLESLGDDNALGGAADDADTFTAGNVGKVTIRGSMDTTVVAAGVDGGADGSFATLDPDTDQASGSSSIDQVRVSGVDVGGNLILADTSIGAVTFGVLGSATLDVLDASAPTLPGVGDTTASFSNGSSFTLTQGDGDVVTFTLRGPGTGTVEYFAAGGAVTGIIFTGTDTRTNVDILVTGGSGDGLVNFTNVQITAGDDSSFNTLNIDANLDGSDSITIDGDVKSLTLGSVSTTGTISIGGRLDRLTTGSVTLGQFDVTSAGQVTVNGSWIGQIWSGESLDDLVVNGPMTGGIIFLTRSIGSVDVNGLVNLSNIGTAGSFDRLDVSVSSGNAITQSVFFAGDNFGSVNITGNVADSDFLAGVSLGADADYDGTDADADVVSQGVMGKMNVRGDWTRSNVAAGVSRGEDTYFGTTDDVASLGISAIDSVTISGSASGTLLGSQSFAFTASGTVGRVLVGGDEFDQVQNLKVKPFTTTPLPLRVTSTSLDIVSGDFLVKFFFNAQVETSTLDDAVIVESALTNALVDDSNYTLIYDEETQALTIRFKATFINSSPDVYTITLEADALLARSGARLDGNSDGNAGDDFQDNFLIGDAGDRTVDGNWIAAGVNFQAATSLNLLMESEKNREITIVGSVGDHPDQSFFDFPQKMDLDIFEITLESGDTYRAALTRFLNGSVFIGNIDLRADLGNGLEVVADEDTLAAGYTVKTTTTYYLVIGSADLNGLPPPTGLPLIVNIEDATGVNDLLGNPIDPDSLTNDVGRYTLTTSITNDGSTGFNNSTQVDLEDGVTTTVTGYIGDEDNGVPIETFIDADVYLIGTVTTSGGPITELTEGMTLTITISVESLGGDLGALGDIGLFRVIDDSDIDGGTLMGAPAVSLATADRPLGPANDFTLTVRIPTTGQYAILVQGSTQTDYQLSITVDTSTAGDRYSAPQIQNVLIETGGGFVDWLGVRGTSLLPFNLEDLGFNGLEDDLLAIIEQEVEDLYANAGITVDVAFRTADFAVPGEFTTIYLANNYGADNGYGGLLGIAQSLDPLNNDRSEEAVVFVNSFTGFVPGQTAELGEAMGQVIAHELGHTLGLRHNANLFDVMFPAYTGIPGTFTDSESALTELLLGTENTHDLLNLIFDTEA